MSGQYTLIIRDANGKELNKTENVESFLLVSQINVDGKLRMTNDVSGTLEWYAFALTMAQRKLFAEIMRLEMEGMVKAQKAAGPQIQVAGAMPPGLNSMRQMQGGAPQSGRM